MAQPLATTKTAGRKAKAVNAAIAPDSGRESLVAGVPAPFDRDQAIREAAYALFEARGGEPGHELDDWLQAEARVQQANGESAPASGVAQVAQRVRLVRGRATASREKTA